MSEGKIGELIKHKRIFLRQTTKDYSAGGNDMLDDVDAALKEAKAEIAHNLELANCLRKDEGEQACRKTAYPCSTHGTRNGSVKHSSVFL